MLRFALLAVLIVLVGRAFWRVVDGVLEGFRGQGTPRVPSGTHTRGVAMARDPICGTYVVPERAVSLTDGGQQLFFCSTTCRDAFRTRTT